MSTETSRGKERERERERRSFIHGITKTITNLFFSPEPTPSSMLRLAGRRLRRLRCGLRCWPVRCQHPTTKITIQNHNRNHNHNHKDDQPSSVKGNGHDHPATTTLPLRVATFNAAVFSMAPAVPTTTVTSLIDLDIRGKAANDRRPAKGILMQRKFSASKRRVSINLPEDEISVSKGKAPAVSHSFSFPSGMRRSGSSSAHRPESWRFSERSVLDVLKEAGADVIALQNVKAEEETEMKPLSDLAEGLGMKYVFAESWAPQYGNAILSKWPIKQWRVQKICDDTDFRNVLKATIDIPKAGEVDFHCTHLDHLDENRRMRQISAILCSGDGPHVLAGGLNSLDETDYSAERWNDIVKYYEEIGKPTPKVEVMKFLKRKQYSDAKNFAGECESVVVVAKGQDVQGTCKYGTRVDYILASPNSPYKFVPGSYGVVSSKGTSDHHIVKVDIVIDKSIESINNGRQQPKQRVVKIDKDSSKGIWRTNS